jgi:radical SAM-linked protein
VARSRLQFRFAKRRGAIHLSHLDTAEHILRAIRRSRLPVLYSQGHRPRPRIGFSPACPTGISSDAEYFEAACCGFPDAQHYRVKLNRVLPDGLEVLEARDIPVGTPPFNEILAATTYHVLLAEQLDRAVLDQRLQAFFSAPQVIIRLRRKGKGKLVDARQLIDRAELTGDGLRLTLGFGRGGTLKISEAIAALLGREALPKARAHKVCVRLGDTPHPPIKAQPPSGAPHVIDLSDLSERPMPG